MSSHSRAVAPGGLNPISWCPGEWSPQGAPHSPPGIPAGPLIKENSPVGSCCAEATGLGQAPSAGQAPCRLTPTLASAESIFLSAFSTKRQSNFYLRPVGQLRGPAASLHRLGAE